METGVDAEASRWGWQDPPDDHTQYTKAMWLKARVDLTAAFTKRDEKMIELMKDVKWGHTMWSPLDPPSCSPTSACKKAIQWFANKRTITLSSAQGNVYYATDGSDPRAPVANLLPVA